MKGGTQAEDQDRKR